MVKKFKMRKMRGGGLSESVSGGGGDLNTLLLIVLVGVLAFIGYQIYKMNKSPPSESAIMVQGGDGDDRYSQPPKPTRLFRAPPDRDTWNPTTLPSIASRGLPDSFQTMGVLTYPGGDIKPLLGRRSANSNNRYNYYTRTDTFNPVPIPLSQGNRDCMDDVGCNEVFDGDKLSSLNGEQVQVKLYKLAGPTYIPAV